MGLIFHLLRPISRVFSPRPRKAKQKQNHRRGIARGSLFGVSLAAAAIGSCSRNASSSHPAGFRAQNAASSPLKKEVSVEIVAQYQHDAGAFTQGLEVDQKDPTYLYESTGRFGYSALRRVELQSGRVVAEHRLAHSVFGEGLTQVGDELWQLSWQNQRLFRYRASDLKVLGEMSYPGEGWGLCFDGKRLVMSDGSASLQFRRREDFGELARVQIKDGTQALSKLNELECARGKVYANIWQSDWIAEIDPQSGRLLRRIDASVLRTKMPPQVNGVLNGIAYRPSTATFLLTGKNWPSLFEVRVPGITPGDSESKPADSGPAEDSSPEPKPVGVQPSQCQISDERLDAIAALSWLLLGFVYRRRKEPSALC